MTDITHKAPRPQGRVHPMTLPQTAIGRPAGRQHPHVLKPDSIANPQNVELYYAGLITRSGKPRSGNPPPMTFS